MAKRKNASIDDVIRLGQQVADVKASVPTKVWKHLVRTSHAQGYTVGGALSGQPNALKERTRTSLKKQAERSIATAYAPGEKQLDDSEARIRALDAKRSADNVTYERWLAAQTAQIDAQGRAADKQINDVAGTVQQQTRDAWATAGAEAKATAGASQGNVSDPNQSTALNFASERAAQGAERAGAAAREATAGTASGEAARVMVTGALAGQMQASKATQAAETNKAIQGVIDDRAKMAISRAGDQVAEFTRLTNAETEKATNTANLNVAAEKLGVQRDELTASTFKANADRAAADKRAHDKLMLDNAKYNLDKGKADLNSDGVVDSKDYKLKKQIDAKYGATNGGGGTAADQKNVRDQYQKVSSITDELIRLHGISKQPAASFRNRLMQQGFSGPQIDLAESLRVNDGKLTPRARKIAQNLGIRFPEKLWGSK